MTTGDDEGEENAKSQKRPMKMCAHTHAMRFVHDIRNAYRYDYKLCIYSIDKMDDHKLYSIYLCCTFVK